MTRTLFLFLCRESYVLTSGVFSVCSFFVFQLPGGALSVHVYGGANGQFVMSEDDGETRDYEGGAAVAQVHARRLFTDWEAFQFILHLFIIRISPAFSDQLFFSLHYLACLGALAECASHDLHVERRGAHALVVGAGHVRRRAHVRAAVGDAVHRRRPGRRQDVADGQYRPDGQRAVLSADSSVFLVESVSFRDTASLSLLSFLSTLSWRW